MADGFDAAKADKIGEFRKLKRTQAWKKLRGFFVVFCVPAALCVAVLWIYFGLEANLPASLLVKIWRLCSCKLFLFVLINIIVISLVIMSGSLRQSEGQEDFYDEFVRRNQATRKDCCPRPVEFTAAEQAVEVSGRSVEFSPAEQPTKVFCRSAGGNLKISKSFSGTARPRGQKLIKSESAINRRREDREEAVVSNSLIVMEVLSNEEAMPAEELQRRSDAFIAKFNRRIRQEMMEQSG